VRRGEDLLLPGASPTFRGVRGEDTSKKLDILSLMLALFLGTASLPHILIRYYTVKDAAAARKSTVVGIVAIACFYVLTLYLGLGAMTSGELDPTDSNMSAPLLARSFSEPLFAVISAIAFTTVLGTVSGLVLAGAGAVAHDLLGRMTSIVRDEAAQVRVAKLSTIVLGAGAMLLGMLFAKLNVSFLVGWAFNIAASANLPALVMLLFWRGTTRQGIVASIYVGLGSSLGWVLLSPDALEKVYGFTAAEAAARTIVPFSQPALVTIPLAFATLVLVSITTRGPRTAA
jgi:cation/acetate symporter